MLSVPVLRIGLLGCTGRMGQMLLQLILSNDDRFIVKGALSSPKNKFLGQDVGHLLPRPSVLNVPITDSVEIFAQNVDVLIDFSSPQALETHLPQAQAYRLPVVIGTTGFEHKHYDLLQHVASNIPIVQAYNMSLAVNLLLLLTEKTAQILSKDYDIEIIEAHHRHKKDAPSGTALALGKAAARGRSIDFNTNHIMHRHGTIGERPAESIGFATVRGGSIPGKHSVLFAGTNDQLCLTHQAYDRSIFAQGALEAARWVQGQNPGLYNMQNVLADTIKI